MELPVAVWGETVLVPNAVLLGLLEYGELLIKLFTKLLCLDASEPFLVPGFHFGRLLELLRNPVGFDSADYSYLAEFLSHVLVGQQLLMLLQKLFHPCPEPGEFVLLTGDHWK